MRRTNRARTHPRQDQASIISVSDTRPCPCQTVRIGIDSAGPSVSKRPERRFATGLGVTSGDAGNAKGCEPGGGYGGGPARPGATMHPAWAISPSLTPAGAQAGTPARAAAAFRSPKPRMSAIRSPRTVRTCQRSAAPPASRAAGVPGDFRPHQKCPGAGGHLRDHRSCTGGSRAGPPRDYLVAVVAVGVVGTLRCAPAGAGVEQMPDGIQIAGLQGEPDSFGQLLGAGIVWHEDLPCTAQLAVPA